MERLWVYDPSESVCEGYRKSIAGLVLLGNGSFRTETKIFSSAVKDLREQLGIKHSE